MGYNYEGNDEDYNHYGEEYFSYDKTTQLFEQLDVKLKELKLS